MNTFRLIPFFAALLAVPGAFATETPIDSIVAIVSEGVITDRQLDTFIQQVKRDYANARYDYITNVLRLKQQAGLLSPEDVYRLDGNLVAPPAATATRRTGSPYPTR